MHFEQLDLRRFHTHVGFYLFLFPVVWLTFKRTSWAPKSVILGIYLLSSTAALLSFLFLSYSSLSKALSGVVLVFWLTYAFVNLKKQKSLRGWAHPFYGIILASCSIGYVIYLSTIGETQMAQKAVRIFMTYIVWGVFVPLCLEKKSFSKPNLIIWNVAVILTSFFVMDMHSYKFLTLTGPLILAGSLLISNFKKVNLDDSRLGLYWLISAVSLFLFGLGLIENQHFTAVGGLHFIVLGPILQSVFNFKKYKFLWIYDFSLFTMAGSITALTLAPQFYTSLHLMTTVSSSVLVIWLILILAPKEILREKSKPSQAR